ncbi:hypothetical protein LEP1GSC132_4154 [Leptospira kirschneri str. 200803703]|uniref:Uncharacterized protein n=1 Tax=Leptospira kirschneri str. 200802841 TaxID=1193047 RepID=A0A828Y1C5_9LEPT|nr:hypothetical protein LEP1GSC131_2085 [Leptospira kirschneri str. 200802841]EMO68511.1 hypothetical protein LEP1GSC132_4154 [Leptospira kirschneri str. 200803703]
MKQVIDTGTQYNFRVSSFVRKGSGLKLNKISQILLAFFVSSFVRKGSGLKLIRGINRFQRSFVSSFVRKGSGLKLNASALTHLVGLFLPLFTKKETKKKYDSFL